MSEKPHQWTDADTIDAMVDVAAWHFGIDPKPDDPDTPEVRRFMEAVLARLRAVGVVN